MTLSHASNERRRLAPISVIAMAVMDFSPEFLSPTIESSISSCPSEVRKDSGDFPDSAGKMYVEHRSSGVARAVEDGPNEPRGAGGYRLCETSR